MSLWWQWQLQTWPLHINYENLWWTQLWCSTQFSSVLHIVPSHTHHSSAGWNKPEDCEGDEGQGDGDKGQGQGDKGDDYCNFFTLVITIQSSSVAAESDKNGLLWSSDSSVVLLHLPALPVAHLCQGRMMVMMWTWCEQEWSFTSGSIQLKRPDSSSLL